MRPWAACSWEELVLLLAALATPWTSNRNPKGLAEAKAADEIACVAIMVVIPYLFGRREISFKRRHMSGNHRSAIRHREKSSKKRHS